MSKPLRVGLIGAGAVCGLHLPAYREFSDRVALAAVCDLSEDAARNRAHEAGVELVYTNPIEMLREAAIDALDICTTHDQHAPLAIAGAESGRHVLVEKPMACSMEECRAMVDAADEAGVTLMVAHYQRLVPTHRAARAGHCCW